ncbi:rod-binding protein [Sphingosinicella sp. LHD-64]|uniref:rod-binding protein n=1 Tax=Sphingosinicella sp. LHD-64 TaxID=3072139 RepID=UPI00280C59EE|nr:rod-binding protein [Sphingosinicella sp. LHD-64]MDQ8757191.1 rod-binding protein [Sphingosinicella sp. LHD-64]
MTGPVSVPPSAATPAPGAPIQSDRQQAQMREAAQAFEAIFLRQMIGSMRQARLAEDAFGSAATDQFRDLGDAQLAESMSRQGSFGIAELLMNQFQRGGGQR